MQDHKATVTELAKMNEKEVIENDIYCINSLICELEDFCWHYDHHRTFLGVNRKLEANIEALIATLKEAKEKL